MQWAKTSLLLFFGNFYSEKIRLFGTEKCEIGGIKKNLKFKIYPIKVSKLAGESYKGATFSRPTVLARPHDVDSCSVIIGN